MVIRLGKIRLSSNGGKEILMFHCAVTSLLKVFYALFLVVLLSAAIKVKKKKSMNSSECISQLVALGRSTRLYKLLVLRD